MARKPESGVAVPGHFIAGSGDVSAHNLDASAHPALDARLDALEAAVESGAEVPPEFTSVVDYGAIGNDASHTINDVYGSLAAALTANPSWSAAHAVYTFVGTDQVDYAALQAAMWDVLNWGRGLWLGALKLHINRTVKLRTDDFRFANKEVRGVGPGETNWSQMEGCVIVQRSDNIPIWETEATNDGDPDEWTSNFVLEGINFVFLNQQESSDTNGIGIHLYSDNNTYGGMMYFSTFRNLQFTQCAYGIKTGSHASGLSSGLWNCLLENIRWSRISITAWNNHGQPTGGMPVNTIINCGVFNTNTGVTSTGPALVLHAGEYQFVGLDIEGWQNTAFYGFGNCTIGIRGLHIEWHRFQYIAADFYAEFPFLAYFADATVAIEDVSLSVESHDVQTNWTSYFRAGGNAKVSIKRLTWNYTAAVTGSPSYTTFAYPQGAGNVIRLEDCQVHTSSVANPVTFPSLLGFGWDTTLHQIRDGSLPAGEYTADFFGAVPDAGDTDNTAAIQRGINFLHTFNISAEGTWFRGGRLTFGIGIYGAASKITLKTGVILEGASRTSTAIRAISPFTDTTLIQLGAGGETEAHGSAIRNMVVHANHVVEDAILGTAFEELCTLEHLEIGGYTRYGIHLSGGVENFAIDDLWMICSSSGAATKTDIRIDGCHGANSIRKVTCHPSGNQQQSTPAIHLTNTKVQLDTIHIEYHDVGVYLDHTGGMNLAPVRGLIGHASVGVLYRGSVGQRYHLAEALDRMGDTNIGVDDLYHAIQVGTTGAEPWWIMQYYDETS